ncbi:MAG TPA: PTS system mannose/fructose/sorbose family transporter subunit IID [bacterium]|nr:PTS system mannose/fructose/sorbose family transporter subunit IID [bacterium]
MSAAKASGPAKVTWLDLAKCFLRQFHLQVLWNYERYLSYGVTFFLLPVLKKAYKDPADRAQAMTRHLEYFNTHPYMASFVLGAVLKMEEEKQGLPPAQQKQKEEEISALKVGMMGPIAAMGDNLFWATIRPYCALIAVTLVISRSFPVEGQFWIMPLLFLSVYNIGHVGLRLVGFLQGYRMGDQVVLSLRKFGFQEAIRGLRLASILLLGVLIVFVNLSIPGTQVGLFLLRLAFFTAIVGLFTFALHRKISPSQMFYAVVLFALMLAFWPLLSGHGAPPGAP